MTTNDIAREWGEKCETRILQLKQKAERRSERSGTRNPWDNPNYESKKRTEVSRAQQHGITAVGDGNTTDYDNPIFDIAHCMWAINLAFLALLVMLMWTIWGWDYNEVKRVVACLGISTVTVQICTYMDGNKSRKSTVWPEIHISGLQSKLGLHGLAYALREAAVIAEEHENDTADDMALNMVPTLLIAVIFRLYTLMRRGFGILFKHRFDKPDDGSRPALVQEMIDTFQLATWIAINLLSVIVCVY